MFEMALANGIYNVVIAALGIIAARTALLWFDKSKYGKDFIAKVDDWSDSAKANYYAGRFIGICLLVGLAL